MTSNEEFLGWDFIPTPEMDADGGRDEYVLLKDGEYPFTVKTLERTVVETDRGRIKAGTKKAVATLVVDGGEAGKALVFENFFLTQNCAWKLIQFAKSIGIRKSGDVGPIAWGGIEGASGRCRLSTHSYTKSNGEPAVKNEVKAFLMPSPEDLDSVPF